MFGHTLKNLHTDTLDFSVSRLMPEPLFCRTTFAKIRHLEYLKSGTVFIKKLHVLGSCHYDIRTKELKKFTKQHV